MKNTTFKSNIHKWKSCFTASNLKQCHFLNVLNATWKEFNNITEHEFITFYENNVYLNAEITIGLCYQI